MERNWKVLGVDHVAIAVKDIEAWKRVYIDLLGGENFFETEDAAPNGPSSMHLCGVKLGGYSVALIEGIDRKEQSQVSAFQKTHGDHSFQHLAVRVDNLDNFTRWAQARNFQFLGPVLERSDAFGPIKQVFARPFDPNLDPDQGNFYEFVERPIGNKFSASDVAGDSFSNDFAKELFGQIESAQRKGEALSFIDLKSLAGK
jgi:catechol 2,3-dioxygenase-like lactoylglutathione lyase family enzyme